MSAERLDFKLTEVPLPSPKHLQHSCDEGSEVDIGLVVRDVEYPYEPNQDVSNLRDMLGYILFDAAALGAYYRKIV